MNIVLAVIVLAFIWTEWDYRAKRDGKREATEALLFAGFVFGIGMLAMNYGGLVGLTAWLIILILALVILLIHRHFQSKKVNPN